MGLPSGVVPFYNMKYTFVIDRIKKVIGSCKTKEQLSIASKYCYMLAFKWRRLTNNGGIESSFKTHFRKLEILTYIDKLIESKRKRI